jgi:8-hydroxy-5-deazaflavin:NADPH oxidoreductase
MSYAIIGFGKVGQALAHAFARKNIDVTVASRRPARSLAVNLGSRAPRRYLRFLDNGCACAHRAGLAVLGGCGG